MERHLFLSYPLRLRYLSIRGFTEPKVVRTGIEPVSSVKNLTRRAYPFVDMMFSRIYFLHQTCTSFNSVYHSATWLFWQSNMVSLHSLYNLRFSSEGTVWSVPYYSEMLTLSCGQIALVVRRGIEPLYRELPDSMTFHRTRTDLVPNLTMLSVFPDRHPHSEGISLHCEAGFAIHN